MLRLVAAPCGCRAKSAQIMCPIWLWQVESWQNWHWRHVEYWISPTQVSSRMNNPLCISFPSTPTYNLIILILPQISYICNFKDVSLTKPPRLLHDVPAPPVRLVCYHDVVDAKRESLGVQKVGEDLWEGGEEVARVSAAVQLEKWVHQAIGCRSVLVLVEEALKWRVHCH